MPTRFLVPAGLLLAISFTQPVSAQDSPRQWHNDWSYPLPPCVGPLADASDYRYSSAYGRARACIEYGTQGEARAVLKYFNNNSQQWLPDIELNGPLSMPALLPVALRLLEARGDEHAELLVIALEYNPSTQAPKQGQPCLAPARQEEVRTYAITKKEGQEVGRQAPNPCLAADAVSDSWARIGSDFNRKGWTVVSVGRGSPPSEQGLFFNVDADGAIHRTYPFSM
jgi:hypothetical protein